MKTGLVQLAASLTGAHLSRQVSGLPFDDVVIDRVVIDSRQITPGCLFVALRGDRFDSHDFLADVAAMGAAAVVVEHCPADFSLPAIVVPDCRAAFGEMGRYWRSKFSLPVIAVTGSNGKTTVKEMIAAILQAAVGADVPAGAGARHGRYCWRLGAAVAGAGPKPGAQGAADRGRGRRGQVGLSLHPASTACRSRT